MGICPKRVYKSLEKESSFSLDLDETMANEETKIVQKDIHDDSHESPFMLSKENEFAIEGDENEITLKSMFEIHFFLLFWIDKIKNDNSYLDDFYSFLQAALILESINKTIVRYRSTIEEIKNCLQALETGRDEIALLLAESKFFPEPSTDNSSEGGEREDT